MPTIQYTAQLDFTDNGTFETGWRIKQGDFGDCEIVFRVVNNGVNMYDALVTPEIVFRRADGASVISNMTPNDGTYKYTFVGNELAVPGLTLVDVKYTDSEGRISTASCRFTVVEDTLGYDPTGAHTYDNPVSELVAQATAASEVAIDSSFKAEGFAVGEQGGVPVSSDSPYYHNNAKYYSLKNAEDIEYYELNGFLSTNLLPMTIASIKAFNTSGSWNGNEYTVNNAKYTVQTDNNGNIVGVLVNTTSATTASTEFKIGEIALFDNTNYILSAGVVGRNSFYMQIIANGISDVNNKTSASKPFTATTDATGIVRIILNSGQTVDNVTIKPMICYGSITNPAYTPYAPSNNALDTKKADITSIGTDESGRTTASKAYAIGEHFYKDGKFCTAKTAIASGATFTLNTNYVEGTVASVFNSFDEYSKSNSSGVASIQANTNEWMIIFAPNGLYTLVVTSAFQYYTLNKIWESNASASYDTSTGVLSISNLGSNRNIVLKRIPFN